jgi:hypothetical protein
MDDEYKQLHPVFSQIFSEINKQIQGANMEDNRPNDQDRHEYEVDRAIEEEADDHE